MLGNWIKATTSTTGTGNLTLAAVTGYPAPSDVFAVNQAFSYVLLDSNAKPLEAGVAYMSSSTVMVRTRVTATYAGGTYNNDNPTALNLSGTVTVLCALHEATGEGMLATVDGQSASVNRWLSSAHRALPAATVALNALRLYHVPFLLRCGAAIQSLNVNVTTLHASNIRAAIYACNHLGYPGVKLAEVPSNLDASSLGNKVGTLTTPVFLPPGWYFASVVSDGTPTLTAYSSLASTILGGSPFGFGANGTTLIDYRYETLGSITPPASAASSTTLSAVGAVHVPCVFLGVA